MRLKLHRLSLVAAAAFALGLTAAMPASAQSLRELYDAARAFDATYLSAVSSAKSVEYRLTQAEAANRPSVAAVASATGQQLDVPKAGNGDSNSVSAALKGSMPLFNRTNDLNIEAARNALIIAKASLDLAEQDLIVRVAQAYFDVLGAQDTLATTRANKTAIAEQLASAKRNFEVGTATITDTREAQAKFDLATAQEIGAENDLRTKRIALDQLVGRTAVTPKPLAVPVVLPTIQPANAEEWVTVADDQQPLVRRARVDLENGKIDTRKARALTSPTVDLSASLGSNNASGKLATLSGTTSTASVGVQLNWPLYTGGFSQARVQETLTLEEKLSNDLQAARRNAAQNTRVAYFGVQSGTAQVKALEAAESSTKLALEATQLGYRVGVRVNLDVLNAQTQLYTTQRDLAKARYDVVVGGLKLRQAAGTLSPSDVDAVNRLLAP